MCGVHTLTFDMTTTETMALRLVRLYHCCPPKEWKRASSVTMVSSYMIPVLW